jgi:hypothetical protein
MRKSARLIALAAAAGTGAMMLLSAGAASASPGPGTYGPGSWFFDQGDGTNAIQLPHTSTSTSTATIYHAQVQQPINADGSSIFTAKSRTIPVKFQVQKQDVITTTTTTTPAVYPDTLSSLNGTIYPGIGSYGALSVSVPTGTTVSQVSNLTASFHWLQGHDWAGSLRWQIDTPDGQVYVYYGDPTAYTQEGGIATNGYSGTNMITQATDARTEGFGGFTRTASQPQYDSLANMMARSAPAGTIGQEPVTGIDLVVDSGFAGTQQVQLSDVQITDNQGTSEYVPGTIAGSTTNSTSTGPLVTDNSAPAWLSITKTSGSTPAGSVDEATLTSTQGDTGGQFRQVDSMYMYNLPVNDLTDKSATYTVGVSFHSDGSSPVANTVTFGLK